MRDLEIYIRDLKSLAVSEWLANHLDRLELDDGQVDSGERSATKGVGRYLNTPVTVSLYPGAFGKRFTCLVLEGESLPWSSDLDCARSAWQSMESEVRCSPGDWKEGEPVEEDKWWRLDSRGEHQVVWN